MMCRLPLTIVCVLRAYLLMVLAPRHQDICRLVHWPQVGWEPGFPVWFSACRAVNDFQSMPGMGSAQGAWLQHRASCRDAKHQYHRKVSNEGYVSCRKRSIEIQTVVAPCYLDPKDLARATAIRQAWSYLTRDTQALQTSAAQ